MAEIQSITLSNFKGAADVAIDISKRNRCPVITLIGLNESGKTTILEGISHFVTGDNAVSRLFEGVHSRSAVTNLIPVDRKAAFSESITISAVVTLDDHDYEIASVLAGRHKLRLSKKSFPNQIRVAREYEFQDSAATGSWNHWELDLMVSSGRSSREREYVSPTDAKAPDLMQEIQNAITARLPRIAYFPTFLVDMPARIYLKPHTEERAVNRYYRLVFQDILDSLGQGLSLEKHVSQRISDFKREDASPNWFSLFFGGPSKAPIDSVFQKISSAVSREVLGSWRRIFQRPISAKQITVEWNIDTQKDDLPYASFVVTDGESRYAISERSLGFRWFFSFLLFTKFKQADTRPTLFLFDEPAANLHAKAQAELLTSFSHIVRGGNRIIYSTHSHHMINPQWLAGAYIVENTALDYDSEDAFALTTKPTNIQASPYRNFVAQYPDRTSYFQPVLEKLDYVTPEIVGAPPYVIVEGISDYYLFKLVSKWQPPSKPFALLPGTGSGASGPLISLLLGRGDTFLVLLDDDRAGRKEAQRYRDEWYLSTAEVKTLADVNPVHAGKAMEKLLSDETLGLIKQHLGLAGMPNKKQIGLYFSEMCATDKPPSCVSASTRQMVSTILEAIAGYLPGSKRRPTA